MKKQVFNPYLPSWEYVPDGEPHVFGDRVYLYGSHDAFGAPMFCVNDYVCWSAPVNDLSDWRYEGVIYKKTQDPGNKLGIRSLYAPDVTKGPDGRYYLYYAFDFLGEFGVAVCDTPAGKYEFYGKVHHRNGKVLGKKSGEQFPFDPGVLTDDDGRIWLYSGFATKVPFIASRWHNLRNDGGVVMELEPDMVTIKSEPKLLFPVKGRDGAFPDHAFFEASSIRKMDGKYYFVYSSQNNHDLCYAISDRPDGGFHYGGVLVDLGDLYLDGRTD
ncbi:MAG: family 43 glycosylhydrolase, partial [Lachnospiraceae bacterium]|nr:family 43 glycosylhydrolase [Lachnospiraceae bacterium]